MSKPTKLSEAELEGAIMRGQSMAKAADWRAALKDQCPLNQDELAAFILAEVRPLFDKAAAELAAKDAEIERLRSESVEKDEQLKRVTDITRVDAHFEPGKMEASMRSEIFHAVAYAMGETLESIGAENCVQCEVYHAKMGKLVLTLQKLQGKTPLALKTEAESARDAALAEIRLLREAIQPLANAAEPYRCQPDSVQIMIPAALLRRAAKAMKGVG